MVTRDIVSQIRRLSDMLKNWGRNRTDLIHWRTRGIAVNSMIRKLRVLKGLYKKSVEIDEIEERHNREMNFYAVCHVTLFIAAGKPLLQPPVSESLQAMIRGYCRSQAKLELMNMECKPERLQLIIKLRDSDQLSEVIKQIREQTTSFLQYNHLAELEHLGLSTNVWSEHHIASTEH